MCVNFEGKVYSVGDGFCYEGKIQNRKGEYHFLIDCGSNAPRKKKQKRGNLSSQKECNNRLDEITDEVASQNNHINLFILTHLHEDHFNGYKLLFSKTKIDTIIMPYLYPEERLCFMMDEDFNVEDYVFLSRPYFEVLRWARERNSEVRLVLIRGSNTSVDQIVANTSDSDNYDLWGEEYEDSENILAIEELEDSKVEVVSVNSNGVKIPNFMWFFKLFNLEADERDINNLKAIIGKLDAKKLHDIVTDPTKIENAKNKYKNVAKDYGYDVNNTSIVVYHAPIDGWGRCGSLLTGDIVLKQKNNVNEILNYYSDAIKNVGVFSIPHHGSEHNWAKKFIANGDLDNTICFASTHNYYENRITSTMMSDLRCHNIGVLVVDENRFNEIEQRIFGTSHIVFKRSHNKQFIILL